MNRKRLFPLLDKSVLLRPPTLSFDAEGKRMTVVDDLWRFDKLGDNNMELRNRRTEQVLIIGHDCVRE